MATNGQVSRANAKGRQRPTIGLLLGQMHEGYQMGIWSGVVAMAEEQDVNLLCFAGESLNSPHGFEVHGNALYDLVSSETVDGLIFMAGSLGNFSSIQQMAHFCDRYRPLPMVSTALKLAGIPSILVDNYEGMRSVVAHLLDEHGYSRVAFLRGPTGHGEADERYRAYLDVLAEHGSPLDPSRVFEGDLRRESGFEAVHALLDERKAEVDAIVCTNDAAALGVVQALQDRGLRIPYDIAVTGFDDLEDARVSIPPLTTVRQPLFQLGCRAVELLLAQLRGESCPAEEFLPMELVVRQSCGCFPEEVLGAAVGQVEKDGLEASAVLEQRREQIRAEMLQSLGAAPSGTGSLWYSQWIGRLLNAFAADVVGQVDDAFLPALDDVLRRATAAGAKVDQWQKVFSALRRQVVPRVTEQARIRIEDLLQQGRVLIGEMGQRLQGQQRLRSEQLAQRLRQLGQTISTMIDLDELKAAVAQELPQLGLERGYISLYDGAQAKDQLRLFLAYGTQDPLAEEAEGQLFPARELVPANLWPRDRRYSFVVLPLFFRDHSIGLALLEQSSRQGVIYTALRDQLSSALWGAFSFRERGGLLAHLQSRAVQLQTAAEVAQAASSILELDVLLQRVVDLVVERFDLYYAGLLLVDPQCNCAVLRAGTGAAGRQMVAQGLTLESGGRSMGGWVLANKEPRIAADVGADPNYLRISLLPDTRSEMVVPLKVGDQVIGLLDVQSREVDAFSEDQEAVFQTMAGQLAVAIENARIVAQVRGLNENLQRTLETQGLLRKTIEALSTPVVPLMRGIILLPLVGAIDSERSMQVIDQLLVGVQQHRARLALVDITGVPIVDTSVANSLIRAAHAVGLLGAQVVLVGIRPEVAQTMVMLGVDLSTVATRGNLQSGIEYALGRMGFLVTEKEGGRG